MSQVFSVPRAVCPGCGLRLSVAVEATDDGGVPAPGDLVLCARCGAVLRYRADMCPRRLRPAEWQALRQDAEAWAAIERAQAERRRGA